MEDGLQLEQTEVVSVWIGTFGTKEAFAGYLGEDPAFYDAQESGIDDAALNDFCREFGFNWYDNDLQDAKFRGEEAVPLDDLLDDLSYGSFFVTDAIASAKSSGIQRANCFVCLYDFEYPAKLLPLKSRLEFVGAFEYKKI